MVGVVVVVFFPFCNEILSVSGIPEGQAVRRVGPGGSLECFSSLVTVHSSGSLLKPIYSV